MRKLAIITTHPIQYYAPIFKLLQQRAKIELKVFYTLGLQEGQSHDPGFGKALSWDIPLLDGYPYDWVKNIAATPGSDHFNGIVNPDLIDKVNKWTPDAILVYGWAYHAHLKAIRYFKDRIPVYFRGDSTLLNEPSGIKKILKTIFMRWVYGHIDHAFCVGKNNKAYFIKYGLTEKQLTFAPHAVDNERFHKSRADEASELRFSLKIKEKDILILFAGKFEPVKNVELLLSSFIKLNRQNVHLLLVGNGMNEAKLKSQANSSRLAGNIHFLDFKNQTYMPVLYQSADLFCLPSKSETWGLSINEAMACEKAILASDKVGCAADLVKNGQNGAVFKSGEINDLTECLLQLTENKAQLVKFGLRSGLIIKDWNFTNIAEAIERKLLHEPY
ncbi:MAG: glycosyl transferase family 1 [Mucilaginibacter sp.]|nr:glycosyl transferase family 1 [Mucilaginibacter sp.]